MTASRGSTHTYDYTWTEKTESRDGEERFTSSEGSALTGEYTEEDDASMTEEIIPTWHALEAPNPVYGISIEDNFEDEDVEDSM